MRINRTGWVTLSVLLALGPIFYFFNYDIFFAINGFNTPWLDVVMFNISQLGDGLTAVIIFLWLWYVLKKRSVAGLIALILVLFTIQPFKSLFNAPRPASVFDDIHIVGEVLRRRSFPSGHAATFIALARVLWGAFHPKFAIWLVFIMILGAISRVYIGVHFPIDIYFGGLLGLLCAELGILISEKLKKPVARLPRLTTERVVIWLILVGSLYAAHSYEIGEDMNFYITFGMFSAGAAVSMIILGFKRSYQYSNVPATMVTKYSDVNKAVSKQIASVGQN